MVFSINKWTKLPLSWEAHALSAGTALTTLRRHMGLSALMMWGTGGGVSVVCFPPADGTSTHCTCIHLVGNGRHEIVVYDVHTICGWQVSIESVDIFLEFLRQTYCPHCRACHESVKHNWREGAALGYEENLAAELA